MSRGIRGISPIGGIIAWIKSFTNVPALATQGRDEWAEVNGQTISDVESPLNGQTLPDIIGTTDGTKKFLRGATTSGGASSNTSHSHCLVTLTYTTFGICGVSAPANYGWMANTTSNTHIPPYYEVVWIVRIK